ncbi:AAA family ATPase [Nannocystis pusilla]|uniref:AAA family ATPase n=1 Tax=Nannocystis pusilla TaxID=889268 RepID=UPI003BF43360
MLRHLHLTNVGPAAEMVADLAPRLNLITGDNGLGKSFLLDIAWWALTRTWPAKVNSRLVSGLMARPRGPGKATIEFGFDGAKRLKRYVSEFDRQAQAWVGSPGRPANPGLVLYAQVDGSFSLWDPARNYWRTTGNVDVSERRPAYVFNPREVWEGLRADDGAQLCNGLLADWALWQKENGEAFSWLGDVLRVLSPPGAELRPGALVRLGLDDVRDIPTIRMPYGLDVPVVHASAGIRRILALSYLLVWSWQEHGRASQQLDQPSAHQVIFLIDEIEAHLHPRWQRRIVKPLLDIVESLAEQASVQIISATQSPLVPASMEPLFDPERDAWFDLDLTLNEAQPHVVLQRRPFVRRGDVASWLTSEAFDLKEARSLEAEVAIEQALALLRGELPRAEAPRIDAELRSTLGEQDRFWIRWSAFLESLQGVA